ncbi:MAG: nucleotidyltransferase family protein, partial [Clostridium sp.]
MNNTQGQFLELLSNGIRDKKAIKIYEDVNWREIIELSKTHKVEGIIYSAIRKSELVAYIDDKDLSDLKLLTFKTGIGQLRDINNLSNIFRKFNEKNIPVIVLKGLVVRDFYPNPEQRSMCDADIFIHKEDLDKTKELLFELGYR